MIAENSVIVGDRMIVDNADEITAPNIQDQVVLRGRIGRQQGVGSQQHSSGAAFASVIAQRVTARRKRFSGFQIDHHCFGCKNQIVPQSALHR